MVEGPGATRNGRKVQAVVGMVLTNVSSQAECKFLHLQNRRLESAVSIGKEVFLVFGQEQAPTQNNNNSSNKPMGLRLHFGMNGVLTVRKQSESSKLAPWRNRDPSRCSLCFANTDSTNSNSAALVTVEMVATTLTVVSATVALSKVDRLKHQDVCGSEFDPQAVLESIQNNHKRQDWMICDALLDQERFPGVGNIIKIEGLHRARIHPQRLVRALSKDELFNLVLECRKYSLGWLVSGRAPCKKVYNQTLCSSCKTGKVRMVKMGQYGLKRVTFWCQSCQPLRKTKGIPSQQQQQQQSTLSNPKRAISGPPAPFCPLHGTKSLLLRRVRNNNNKGNLYRLFRTCKRCQYFGWADAHFPKCHCGKPSILRASKTERTGGQWFLSCGSANKHQRNNKENTATNVLDSNSRSSRKPSSSSCSFFQWATPCQLAPLASDLSPLT